jgi:hypothetical protein
LAPPATTDAGSTRSGPAAPAPPGRPPPPKLKSIVIHPAEGLRWRTRGGVNSPF